MHTLALQRAELHGGGIQPPLAPCWSTYDTWQLQLARLRALRSRAGTLVTPLCGSCQLVHGLLHLCVLDAGFLVLG